MARVQCIECERKDTIGERVLEQKKRNFVFRIQDRKKEAMVELGSSSMPYRKKSTAEWCTGRDPEKYSKRRG